MIDLLEDSFDEKGLLIDFYESVTDPWTDRRTQGQTGGQTEGRTDGQTNGPMAEWVDIYRKARTHLKRG